MEEGEEEKRRRRRICDAHPGQMEAQKREEETREENNSARKKQKLQQHSNQPKKRQRSRQHKSEEIIRVSAPELPARPRDLSEALGGCQRDDGTADHEKNERKGEKRQRAAGRHNSHLSTNSLIVVWPTLMAFARCPRRSFWQVSQSGAGSCTRRRSRPSMTLASPRAVKSVCCQTRPAANPCW